MNDSETANDRGSVELPTPNQAKPQPHTPACEAPIKSTDRTDARRWWIKLVAQPLLFLTCGMILIMLLGAAQRMGWITAGGVSGTAHASPSGEGERYICPMMCTPPQSEPGRCPVCAMELVPATSDGGNSDSQSIQIDPAARRVANIQTVAAESVPVRRTIRAIGEISYDESTLKTISAYVDGRLERLYADYTGVVVQKGDRLALLYSPRLYSSQVELLLAKKAWDQSRKATLPRAIRSGRDLYENTRRRLLELGITEQQITQLEETNDANSRLHLCAPIGGTVIEKLAVEGQYVQEGDAIYRLADLSTVWLMLKLFPEDAAAIRHGQKVEAEVQSLPGRTFTGRVAFIDPHVDAKTRTVGVRVTMQNGNGHLRVGDYAKATIDVPVDSAAAQSLAGRALVVPRTAVLMAGNHSVVYVETAPGRFEIRPVVLGPSNGDKIAILSGIREGEQVATRGNFLIDSQMQLAGNPSLIDPANAQPDPAGSVSPEVIAALSALPPEDRLQAEEQRICPVTEMLLGSMGTPRKVDVNGTPVFICCEGCRQSLLAEPRQYLARLADRRAFHPAQPSARQSGVPPIGDLHMIGSSDPSPGGGGGGGESIEIDTHHEGLPPVGPLKQVERPQEAWR